MCINYGYIEELVFQVIKNLNSVLYNLPNTRAIPTL